MKRTVIFLWMLVMLVSLVTLPVGAQANGHSWYCKHVKGHGQPPIGSDLSFVEECGGYYIDRRNSDPNAAQKVIYLTFDVGYENGNVARVLDTLKEENVTAAFFILGNVIERNTELVRRMVDEGHTVGNHTVHHKNMAEADEKTLLEELHALESLYEEKIGGKLSSYYRPPEGRFSKENLLCAKENGYTTVFWSFAYPDWDNGRQMPTEMAKRIILENAHNGEIMLLHPTLATNAEILGEVIRTLKSEGYRFGTLDELTQGAD